MLRGAGLLRFVLRVCAALAVASAAGAQTPAPPPTTAPAPASSVDSLLNEVDAAANQLCGTWDKLAAHPDTPKLSTPRRSTIYYRAAMCKTTAAERQPLFLKATAGLDSPAGPWIARAANSMALNDTGDALFSLESAAERSPESLRRADGALIFSFWRAFAGEIPSQNRLLAVLDKADWRPPPMSDPSNLWRTLATRRMAAGDMETARRATARIRSPAILLQMQLDKRFDAIAPTGGWPVVRQLVTQNLEAAQAAAPKAGEPEDPNRIRYMSRMLRYLNRANEAVPLFDPLLASPGPVLGDGQDQRAWLLDSLAYALDDAGRIDEAIITMRQATAIPERGSTVNVSQTLNLAGLLAAAGRNQEVLDLLADLDAKRPSLSPPGRMFAAAYRACAYVGLGQGGKARAQFALTSARPIRNDVAFLIAAGCLADTDAAAKHLIEQLATEDQRGRALVVLSRFLDRPRPTQLDVRVEAMLEQLRGRPDVLTAVAKVGRIGTFEVSGTQLP